MARIATLLGKDAKSGSWSSFGVAEGGEELSKLVAQYNQLRSSGGILRKGKTEMKLSDVRLLASATSSGELKAKLRFR